MSENLKKLTMNCAGFSITDNREREFLSEREFDIERETARCLWKKEKERGTWQLYLKSL